MQLVGGSGDRYGGCPVNDEGVQLVPETDGSPGCVCPGLHRAHSCKDDMQIQKECNKLRAQIEPARKELGEAQEWINKANAAGQRAFNIKDGIEGQINFLTEQYNWFMSRGMEDEAAEISNQIDRQKIDLAKINKVIRMAYDFKKSWEPEADKALKKLQNIRSQLEKKGCDLTIPPYVG